MKKFLTAVCLVFSLMTSVSFAQKKGASLTWPGIKYSYVKLYLYNLDNQLYGQYQVLKNHELNFTLVHGGVKLSETQAKNLMGILNSDTQYLNEGLAKCYEPHHAFVFYGDNDEIVAACDVCFLCEGVKFYPSKNYAKEITTYTEALTKEAEKKLNAIQNIIEETEIPVFSKSQDYIDYGKAVSKVGKDTLFITNDSIFRDLVNPFKSLSELKNNIAYADSLNIDSVTRITGGGKKVNFYSMKNDKKTHIECSSYSHGSLWITEYETSEKSLDVINAIMVGDTKIDAYKALNPAFKDFFYNSIVKITNSTNTEYLIFSLDEKSFVNYIKYYHYH